METTGRNGLRSSHLELLSLCPLKKWEIWSLDIKSAMIRGDSFHRDPFVHALPKRGPSGRNCSRELRVAAYGLIDAPAASFATLHKYLLYEGRSISEAGKVSAFLPITRIFALLIMARVLLLRRLRPALMIFLDVETAAFWLRRRCTLRDGSGR